MRFMNLKRLCSTVTRPDWWTKPTLQRNCGRTCSMPILESGGVACCSQNAVYSLTLPKIQRKNSIPTAIRNLQKWIQKPEKNTQQEWISHGSPRNLGSSASVPRRSGRLGRCSSCPPPPPLSPRPSLGPALAARPGDGGDFLAPPPCSESFFLNRCLYSCVCISTYLCVYHQSIADVLLVSVGGVSACPLRSSQECRKRPGLNDGQVWWIYQAL